MLQLYINFPADEHVMIYTYPNFISTFLQMNTWWYIHTATLYQLSCRWTRDDIYIPQLYIIHTATLYQFSCRRRRDDIYIPQLYINFPTDELLMIYTHCNFISTLLQMITWWYIHTVTLYNFSSRWTGDNIYIPQLYMNFPAVERLMIYIYCNFISIFQQMNTWWFIHTRTLYQLSCRSSADDICIPQLCIYFPAVEHLMIYT